MPRRGRGGGVAVRRGRRGDQPAAGFPFSDRSDPVPLSPRVARGEMPQAEGGLPPS